MYHNQSQLQKRLRDFAEAHNIELLSQTVPDYETRLGIIKEYIRNKNAEHASRTDS